MRIIFLESKYHGNATLFHLKSEKIREYKTHDKNEFTLQKNINHSIDCIYIENEKLE